MTSHIAADAAVVVHGGVPRNALLLPRRLPDLRFAERAGLRSRGAEAGITSTVLGLVRAKRHRRTVRHRHCLEAAGQTEGGTVAAGGLRGMPTDRVRFAG